MHPVASAFISGRKRLVADFIRQFGESVDVVISRASSRKKRGVSARRVLDAECLIIEHEEMIRRNMQLGNTYGGDHFGYVSHQTDIRVNDRVNTKDGRGFEVMNVRTIFGSVYKELALRGVNIVDPGDI